MFDFTIKQKLMGLAGIVVAVFMIFSVVYSYASDMQAEVAKEAERDMVIEEAETASRIAILQARRNEKDFLLRNNTKYVEKHAQTMRDLYEQLNILQQNIRSEEGLDAVQQLSDLSQEYEKGFQLMVAEQIMLGINEKSGLLGSLRKSVHDVEVSLKEFNNDPLAVKMLMMRRHEKDYIARGDEKYIGRMAERKGQFGVLLQDSGIPKLARRDIRSNMDSYHNDFNALTRGMKKVKKAIAEFRETIHATEPAFDRVEAIVHELRHANEVFSEQTNHRIALLFIITMIIGGVIIFAGVFLLARDISRRMDEAVHVCSEVAKGKLGLSIKVETKDEIGQLLSSMKFMDEKLMTVVNDVQDSVLNISSASNQIAQGNATLAQRTEEQASSLEETASSMAQMNFTVKQNADSAAEAKSLADANSKKAVTSADIVARTVSAMVDIDDSSKKISDIIGTIDGIAFQSNLLALNAAVEAARAGEQGRGFAVVASEVRSLAQRSADAAKEIKNLIEDSVSKVKIGIDLVGESGRTLEEITDNTKKVASIIDGIAMASNEQATGIGHVSQAVNQMDSVTQSNAALVEQTAASSVSLQEQSKELDSLIAFFHIGDETHRIKQPDHIESNDQVRIVSQRDSSQQLLNRSSQNRTGKEVNRAA